jgi:cysteine desulfurase
MIYLDNAATTPLCNAAKQTIIEHLDNYGNPSSSYEWGRVSKDLIENAREKIASLIGAKPTEIYFTSGGSEADTWALESSISIASDIEHHAIQPSFKYNVENNGIVDVSNFVISAPDDIEPLDIADIISCMAVNNEIGTIQPISRMANFAHNEGMIFHTDAVQAIGHIPINVKDMHIDMMSASGHKFGAMKGIGFLYVKEGIDMFPLIFGGKQEFSKRGGTENILGILSMAAALEDSIIHMEEDTAHITKLRNKLRDALLSINGIYLNGDPEQRICSNINVRIDSVKGADFVTMCGLHNICISSGSACNEGVATPSHVLKAIGLSDEAALSSVRITLGRQNTEEEIDYAIKIMTGLISQLRGA